MAALATLGDAALYQAHSDLVEPNLRSILVPIDRSTWTGKQLDDPQDDELSVQTLHICKASSQISKSSRTLMVVCAKVAHAHMYFGRLIAEIIHTTFLVRTA